MGLDGTPHSTAAGSTPARFIGRKAGQQKPKKLSKHEVRKMNEYELVDIAEKLFDRYGSGKRWEIVKAEKTENGWNLTIQPAKEKQPTGENGSM